MLKCLCNASRVPSKCVLPTLSTTAKCILCGHRWSAEAAALLTCCFHRLCRHCVPSKTRAAISFSAQTLIPNTNASDLGGIKDASSVVPPYCHRTGLAVTTVTAVSSAVWQFRQVCGSKIKKWSFYHGNFQALTFVKSTQRKITLEL